LRGPSVSGHQYCQKAPTVGIAADRGGYHSLGVGTAEEEKGLTSGVVIVRDVRPVVDSHVMAERTDVGSSAQGSSNVGSQNDQNGSGDGDYRLVRQRAEESREAIDGIH
jgi:hypothetical protein